MKPGTKLIRVVMLLFFAGIVAYFGVYTYRALDTTVETAQVYSYTAEDSAAGDGYLVRAETPLEGAGEYEEIVPAEGERLGVGDTVAKVYSSEDVLDKARELEDAKDQLANLEYILSYSDVSSQAEELSGKIIQSIEQLQVLAAGQDLSGLEECAGDLKDMVFRQNYTYNGTDAVKSEISNLEDQIDELKGETKDATSTVKAKETGIYSCMVDGYEGVLTPDALSDLTPSGLTALAGQQAEVEDGTYLGKLITSDTWYVAVSLDEGVADKLHEGSSATVRFSAYAGDQQMTVTHISAAEDGKVAVVLSSDRYLSQITLLREEQVQVIYASAQGLRIPKQALRTKTVYAADLNREYDTDSEAEDKAAAESAGSSYTPADTVQQTGVYRISGTQAEWVAVTILAEGDDYYVVQSAYTASTDGTALTDLQKAKALRDGDTVIARGRNLYDGKVIEY